MGAEFRVLGDVAAVVDGRRLEIGHARQRSVLASLLVDANHPVSSDQLIDRVWADAPPHRARNALAAYISRLRQLIAGIDGAQVTRGPGGYTLTIDSSTVDLHRFRATIAAARACVDQAKAAAMLDEALTLWRGEPLAHLDTPWARDVRSSLAAERFSAILDRNDAALATGRHAELLPELATASEDHPLDERIAAQLMLALYRSGRQADALETYRVVRERLVDELGADPSPGLRDVHRRILDGERPPSPPPVISPVPVIGIPRRATRLVGRDDDAVRISAVLRDGPVLTLTGVGGVGKTRLALEVAEREHPNFADGAFFCELAPLGDGAAVGQAAAAALQLQRGQSGNSEADVIDHLRTRELLLVMDNCEHVLSGAAQFVDTVARNCPRVTVLATSRESLGVEGERVVPVHPLTDDHAVELFADRARASKPDFAPEREPVGAVAEICRRLDGVPLAIELAAARIRAMSSLDIARRLDRLRLLRGGTRGAHPRQQSVEATIDWSYRLLEEPEQDLFARLSVFAGGCDLDAAHGVCADPDSTEDDTIDLLAGLVDKSMVVVRNDTGPTRYSVLETLRAYGRERLRERHLLEDVAARHARYYIELVARAADGIHGPDERQWIDRMTPQAGTTYRAPDFDNMRAAFEWAMAESDVDLALRLVTSLPELVHIRVGYHSFDWLERAIDIAEPDHPLFPAAVGTAARGHWVLGEFGRARWLAALADGRVPLPGTTYLAYPADVLVDIGTYEGKASTALAYYEAEQHSTRCSTDPIQLVWVLYSIVRCHQVLGASAEGRWAGREAVRAAEATGNPSTLSMAHCALGIALADSDPAQALRSFDLAVDFGASVENNFMTGMAGMERAALRARLGDPDAARLFSDVIDHWEAGGPLLINQQWDTLRYVARLMLVLGEVDAAVAVDRALRAAGRVQALSPTDAPGVVGAQGDPLTGVEAVELARTVLRRHL